MPDVATGAMWTPLPEGVAVIRALVACEESGVVRAALRALGHDAWSCDLRPAADASRHHLQCDVREVLDDGWDLLIAHPPCTYLCSSGLHWNTRVAGRAAKTADALALVQTLLDAKVPYIALENPRGCIGTAIRPAQQVVQPYEFGDDASKETHLWLVGLPSLVRDPAARVPGRLVTRADGRLVERWANQTDSGQNRLGPSATRAQQRAQTYPGLARAMAAQWPAYIERIEREGWGLTA